MDITKTLALVVVALLCITVLVTPVGAVGASMLLRGGLAGSGVTDPGTLTLLGASLVTLGVWTRRVFFGKRRTP